MFVLILIHFHFLVISSQNDTISYQNSSEAKQFEESYEAPKELSWTNINDQVDFVIPMFLNHLQYMKIEHLNLPDVVESISLVRISLKFI